MIFPPRRAAATWRRLTPAFRARGAILLYGIPRVVIGENRTFVGEEELLRARGVTVVRQEPRCIEMMTAFIRENPRLWDEDIGE